ncbi:MliC family protein [Candidatus Pantoea persica]|uniref:MliC family protein n=1 Tax=Candidatus Pantoea persica TaxID=2518128 RepID=UPI00215D8DB4|nr:MliC family protein [Candidatus Pantoea persica]MBA2816979.1 Membrane-bound lysozyme inhibitor of C-type lysozyme precursor [Candidatus Pantoea persica]
MKQGLTLAASLLLTGCGLLHKQPEPPQTLHYCCGTLPLTVTLDNASEQVSFIMDGQPLTLKRAVSASGARYSDGKYVLWSKGDTAFIERDDKIVVNDCELQPASQSAHDE